MALNSPVHLRQTERFISIRPVEISVERRTKTPTTRGGFSWSAPVLLAPQTVRKVGTIDQDPLMNSDGKTVVPNASIIAMPDADLQIGDKFSIDSVVHEIVAISRLPEWRIDASVVVYGL